MSQAQPILNGAHAPIGKAADPAALTGELLAAARALRAGDDPAAVEAIAARLHTVDPFALSTDGQRIAFWINVYNALFLHATHLRPLRLHLALHRRLFRAAAYRVGRERYSLDVIEHGLLRRGARAPGSRRPPLAAGDPRLAAAPSALDPRVHFALNCGARSCPPINAYEPASFDDHLEEVTRAYMAAECDVDPVRGRVVLPGLMRLYRADFGTRREAVAFAARMLPSGDRDLLERTGDRIAVSYHRFDARIAVAEEEVG